MESPDEAGQQALNQALGDVLTDYKAAVLAKDVDRFVALYAPDMRVFDMWGVWSYDGVAPWRDMVAGWFGSLGDERVVVDFSDVQTVVAADLAVIHAFVSFQAVNTEGVTLRSMDNRLTMTLKRHGGGWTITHQHTSSPIAPATASVMFKR